MDFQIDPRIMASRATQPITDKKTKDLDSLRESSREFEALLLMEMLKSMRKSVPEGGLFDKDTSSEIFRDMLDSETAKAASRGKGLGIGEAMYKQMAELIEKKK
ncbi:MAG: rod-binding protein [Proteobacteria bacterium]|nr:rod-binding protein [Pseudomonadota bacterium]